MATSTVLNLTANTVNVATYQSGAFTPVAGDLLVVFASAVGNNDTAPSLTSSVSGQTFTLVSTHAMKDTNVDGVFMFVANQLVGASPASQTVTLIPSNNATVVSQGCYIELVRLAGMTKTGTTAVRAVAGASNQATGGTPAVTFGAATLTGNVVHGVVLNDSNPATLTQPTGFSEFQDLGIRTPVTGFEHVGVDSGFASTTLTWGSTSGSNFCALAAEFDTTSGSSGITGSMAATESFHDAFASSGQVKITGHLTATEPFTDAFAASGGVGIHGSMAATEPFTDTFAATGTTGNAISAFTENFNATLDTAKWTAAATGVGDAVVDSGGVLDMSIVGTASTPRHDTMYAANSYSLIGSSIYVKLVRPLRVTGDPVGVTNTIFYLEQRPAVGNHMKFYVTSDGWLVAATDAAYAEGNVVNICAGTYFANAATHAWLRMRESAGIYYWDTAPDAGNGTPGTWVNRASVALASMPANFNNSGVNFEAHLFNATAGTPLQSAQFDGMNTAANSSAINGSMAATEPFTDTFASSGQVKITGHVTATEPFVDSISISGKVKITGHLTATEPFTDTFAATAHVAVAGHLTATEPFVDSISISGKVAVHGSMAATESFHDSFSASGKVAISGHLTATEPFTDAFAATGKVAVHGSMAATESFTDTFSTTGHVAVTGHLTATEPFVDSFAISGKVAIHGSMAAIEPFADSFHASSTTSHIGSMAAIEPFVDTFAATGQVSIHGSMAATEQPDTFSANAKLIVTGSMAATEPFVDSFAATGMLTRIGSMAATETFRDDFNASGQVQVAGVLIVSEPPDIIAMTGQVIVTGSIHTTEPFTDGFHADGTVQVSGTVSTQFFFANNF